MDMTQFVYSTDGHLSCLQFGAFKNKNTTNLVDICIHSS